MAAACFRETNTLCLTNKRLYRQRHSGYSHNHFDDASVDSSSGTIIQLHGRVNTYLRSTMRVERISGLALLHAYMDTRIDT